MATIADCAQNGHRMRGAWADPTPARCADCGIPLPITQPAHTYWR